MDPTATSTEHARSAPAPREVASLPGPRGWPLLGSMLQLKADKAHLILENWAREYGPVYKVRLGRKMLVVLSDHEVAMKALRERPHEYTRSTAVRPIFEELGFVGVFAAEGDEWRRQRPLVVRALDPAHLKRFFPIIVTATQRLHRRWMAASSKGRPIEVKLDLTRFTVDVICSLAFGTDVATLEKHEPDPLQIHLDRIFAGINRRIFSAYPTWRYFKSRADRQLEESVRAAVAAVNGYIGLASAQMQARPELFIAPENLLQALLAATQDERLSESEMIGNVLTMLLAGEDTTSATLAWTMYLLACNPQAQEAVRRESNALLGKSTALEEFDLTRELKLTEAALMEGLRLKPVAPLLSLSPVHETVLAGVKLPARSRVIVLNRMPGIDAKRFAQPDAYRPERWVDAVDGGAAADSGLRRAVTPFGAGARFCPGRYLAMLEAKMALAMVLNAFDVSHGGEAVEESQNLTMHPLNLRLTLTPRAR